ncbi:MAG TPA: hypothetical protein DEZ08_00405 [Dehalococcoidia bacterium]|nr:hypothetical protein [Dehalococcoidia bacterium]
MKQLSKSSIKKIALVSMLSMLTAAFIVACSGGETPAAAPAEKPAEQPAAPAAAAPVSAEPTALPVVQPTVAPAAEVVAKDSIVVVINTEPTEPDPWLSTTLYPNQLVQNIAQPMSFLGPDFVDTKTAGFSGWEMKDDGASWILNLNEGMEFHNGEPWNAEAAKYSIDFLGQCIECGPYGQVGDSHAEVIDDYTVEWFIDNKHPALPRFSQYSLFRAPIDHAENMGDAQAASGHAIGWGPYEFGEWVKGEKYVINKFDGYNADSSNFLTQAGSINTATFVFRNEETVRAAMIRAGEADIAWGMAGDMAAELEDSDHGAWVKIVSGEVYTLDADTIWHPELKKLKVRQAITHAIDCEELALALFGPTSRCSSGPNGIPGTLGVNETNWKPKFPYDPAKAKQLLEEADYNFDNQINYYSRAGRYAKDVELSESLGVMWAQAGINIKINIVESSVWNKYHKAGPAVAYKAALETGMSHEEAVAAVHAGEPPADPGASPGLVQFAPGGEYFDFGRQINFYMNCTSVRSSNCDADSHTLGLKALASGGDERRQLMEEVYEVFTDRLYQIPVMELVSVWGVNKDLAFVNQPGGRRILVNTAHFK